MRSHSATTGVSVRTVVDIKFARFYCHSVGLFALVVATMAVGCWLLAVRCYCCRVCVCGCACVFVCAAT